MISVDPRFPRGIVWLASFPKSGNTWLRAFIFALRKLRSGRAIEAIDLDEMVYSGETDRDVDYYARYLSGPATAVARDEIAAARGHVQRDIAMGSLAPVYIKTHNARVMERGFPTINLAVSVGAVYLVRNPLDVAVSWSHFRGVDLDQAIADMARPGNATVPNGNDVHMVLGSWSENVHSWTGEAHPAVLVARYEDMLDEPLAAFTAIARHLRLDASPEQIERAAALASFDRLQRAELATGFLEKPPEAAMFFRHGQAGQWREALTAEQVARVVAAHGPEMARFGYLPAAELPSGLTALAAKR